MLASRKAATIARGSGRSALLRGPLPTAAARSLRLCTSVRGATNEFGGCRTFKSLSSDVGSVDGKPHGPGSVVIASDLHRPRGGIGSSAAKMKRIFECSQCGAQHMQWHGKCTECGAFGTIEESVVSVADTKRGRATGSIDKSPRLSAASARGSEPVLLNEVLKSTSSTETVASAGQTRFLTGIEEFDRVMGGGIVPGSLILIGGEPGVREQIGILTMGFCSTQSWRGVCAFRWARPHCYSKSVRFSHRR